MVYILTALFCFHALFGRLGSSSIWGLCFPDEFQQGRVSVALDESGSLEQAFELKSGDWFERRELSDMMAYAKKGDIRGLQERIERGFDVNFQDAGGVTLLAWAFAYNQFETFRFLLESGADPGVVLRKNCRLSNVKFLADDSVLFTASRVCRPRFQLEAIKYSQDVNVKDGSGEYLLHLIAWKCPSSDALIAMKESGANLDVVDKDGSTALMTILYRHPLPLAKTLLECGARADAGKGGREFLNLVLEMRAKRDAKGGRDSLFAEIQMMIDLSESKER